MKKRFSILEVGLILSIVLLATGVFSVYTKMGPMSKLTVMAAGIPDAYGNRIFGVYVFQNTTGTWTQVTYVEYSMFTNGTTLSIPANQKTIIQVIVNLNTTMASDATTAGARTRVYITISTVVTSGLMVQSGGGYAGLYGCWQMIHWYPSSTSTATSVWTPTTDTTYTVTIQYQAYY